MSSLPAWAERLDNPNVILGAHINALRGFKISTQAELADAIGVTQSTLSKKVRGEVGFTFGELLQLADFFEVSVEDLIPPQYAGERVIGRYAEDGSRLRANVGISGTDRYHPGSGVVVPFPHPVLVRANLTAERRTGNGRTRHLAIVS